MGRPAQAIRGAAFGPALALLALGALLAPAGIPVFAGLSHSAYHLLTADRHDAATSVEVHAHGLSDHAARHAAEHAAAHLHDDDALAHSHSPEAVSHTHMAVVDRAIALAGIGGETQMGPPPSREIDQFAPPKVQMLEPVVARAPLGFDAPAGLVGRLMSAPPVPPPRG